MVGVLVEEGGHGGVAGAPIARDIIKAYYDKKAKKDQGQVTAENQPEHSEKTLAGQRAEASKLATKPEEAAAIIPTGDKGNERPE